MAPSSTPGDDKNTDMDIDETSTAAQPSLTPREGQLLQGIASLQMQLNVVSQRQDELMGLVGVLREQQEGPVPDLPSGVRGRTVSPRGSVSYAMPGVVPPAGDGAGGQPTSNPNHLLPSERPLNAPPNHLQPPPSHSDPITFAHPNGPPLQQGLEHGRPMPGFPNTQKIPPSQGQGRDSGQPPLDQNGQSLGPPPRCPVHPLGHSVPIFGQLQDPRGQVVGLVHRGSFTVSGYTSAGPSVRQLPPGYPHMPPQMYPEMQPHVHPQMPPQVNPQIPAHVHPQMPPQTQTQDPVPTNWGAPPGPPPPYFGPGLAPGEPMPGMNRAGPSTTQRRASRTSGTVAVLQQRSLRSYSNEGQEDDGIGLDVRPVPRREATGRAPTRANPARKARPTQFSESD